jgi:hypothetical protein
MSINKLVDFLRVRVAVRPCLLYNKKQGKINHTADLAKCLGPTKGPKKVKMKAIDP